MSGAKRRVAIGGVVVALVSVTIAVVRSRDSGSVRSPASDRFFVLDRARKQGDSVPPDFVATLRNQGRELDDESSRLLYRNSGDSYWLILGSSPSEVCLVVEANQPILAYASTCDTVDELTDPLLTLHVELAGRRLAVAVAPDSYLDEVIERLGGTSTGTSLLDFSTVEVTEPGPAPFMADGRHLRVDEEVLNILRVG